MQDLRLYQLLHKKLSDKLSPDEDAELTSIRASQDISDIEQDIDKIWHVSKEYFPSRSFDTAAAKSRFKKKIASTTKIQSKPSSANTKIITGIAAAFVVAALFYAYFILNKAETITAEDTIEYALLDDQTEVWLNDGSTLEVTSSFLKNDRKVRLDGEAHFKVAADPSKKFVVEMNNGTTVEVIGTEFIVNSDEDNQTSVTVFEGKVRFAHKDNPELTMIISRGEKAIFDAINEELSTVDHNEAAALIMDSFSFDNTPLTAVFAQLSETFHVTFDYDEASIDNCRMTSPLANRYNLNEILEVIVSLKSVEFPDFAISKVAANSYEVSGIHCK